MFPGAALVLALSLGGFAPSALAAPIAFTVDPVASSGTVLVKSTLGSPPAVAISLSGSLTADAALVFSDFEILLASPPLYALSLFGSGVGASLSGPAATGFAVAPGLSLFDLVGSAIAFDSGLFRVTGTYFGVGINEVLDLATSPLLSVFPIDSVAQMQVAALGGGGSTLRLSLPFSAPLHLSVNGQPVTVTFAGSVVANGTSVPEPASVLLLGLALLGLGWLRSYRSAIS